MATGSIQERFGKRFFGALVRSACVVLLLGGGSLALGQPATQLESGVLSVGGDAVTVTLARTYTSPVVVCSVQYDNNTLPVVPRVSGVTSTSFTVRLQNPSNSAGVVADQVSYLVVEEGTWTIEGVKVEAQIYTSTVTDHDTSWVGELQSYGQTYVSPVVLGQVMTESDPDWSTFWSHGATPSSPPSATVLYTGKAVGEDPDVTRNPETIGFIVIEAGHGTLAGVEFEAALGPDSVGGVGNAPPYSYNFTTGFSVAPQVIVTHQAAMDGGHGSWSQTHGASAASPTTLFLSVDEDQIGDPERLHTKEQVAYVAFASPVTYPGTVCGNGEQEAGEACDDGNTNDGDGCSALCAIETVCGDGNVEGGEGCDDGNADNSDTCPDGPGGTCQPATCGDDFVQAGAEGCDDGNGSNDDGCPDGPGGTCQPSTCGDGFVWAGNEECDDAAANSDILPDACRVNCTAAACGDGVLDSDEHCDDGNTIDGDTCPANCLNLPVTGVAQLESGTVAVGAAVVTVTLSQVFVSPVVVCTANYRNNTAPVITRVSNVNPGSPTTFDVRLQQVTGPDDSPPPTQVESVSYLVVEEGVWTIDDVDVEAQTFTANVADHDASWAGQALSYGRIYAQPVVLGQVMSENDSRWSSFWSHGGSRTIPPSPSVLFGGLHVGEDPDLVRAAETIGVIVFEAGHGTIAGAGYEARLGPDTVSGVNNAPPFSYLFQVPFGSAPQVAVLSQAAMDGVQGSWAQTHGVTPASTTMLHLSVDEDQIKDAERSHTTEQVGYVVFETPVVYPGTVCGNGIVDPGEDCDDANGINTDDCPDGPGGTCTAATCGDGFAWAGNEACDDGDSDNTDACLDSCTLATCGDGFVHLGVEGCDDNANIDGDGCAATCTVEPGWSCAGTEPSVCTDADECVGEGAGNDCHIDATCANTTGGFTCTCNSGYSGDGASCTDDDECVGEGAGNNCDANAACTNLPGSFSCSCDSGYSGDGVNCTDDDECAGEGAGDNCDANAFCTNTGGSFTCTCNAGYLGDGVTCTQCGNGVVNAGEECDDGNAVDDDLCSNACTDNICGNSRVDIGEDCDDGNTIGGDGCSAICSHEGPQPRLEAGTVTSVGAAAYTVALSQAYVDPVVVCAVHFPNQASAPTPVVARVSEVTSTSFDVRLQAAATGTPGSYDVSYLVVEAGSWTMDGVDIEAQWYVSSVTDNDLSWVGEQQAYLGDYDAPVVIGQVQTENDPAWSTFWSSNGTRYVPPSTTSIWTGKHVGEDGVTARVDETIGFIVIEAGHGTIGGIEFEAAVGTDTVLGVQNGPPFSYAFAMPFLTAPTVVVPVQTAMDGVQGGWAQTHGTPPATTTSLLLSIDEDTLKDAERAHTTEQVAYVAFASSDDGNTLGGDGCDGLCELECGNDVLDTGEACDDGNTTGGDGCSADCKSDETCGNFVVDLLEDCDDGNTTDGDGCDALCATECGNGVQDSGEACDDGNTVGGDGCSADCQISDAPLIDVWYGDAQAFGAVGVPQTWVNVLGNASDPQGVVALSYSLNSAAFQSLSIGPDGRRLNAAGDFNIEIDYQELQSGANSLVIRAVDGQNNVADRTLAIDLPGGGSVWPDNYSIDWPTVTDIQDAVQIVDGLWTFQPEGIRPALIGYDRALAFGDRQQWDDYELLIDFTVNSVPPGATPLKGIGLIIRWLGHSDDPVVCAQPRCGWRPNGNSVWWWFTDAGGGEPAIFHQGGTLLDPSGRVLDVGTRYFLKVRVESSAVPGDFYGFKVWADGETEPIDWTHTAAGDPTVAGGSLLLLTHNLDATWGNAGVVKLPDNISPTVPTGLQAAPATWSRIDLTWAAAGDNVKVTKYKIYRNGVEVGMTGETFFSDTGLSPSTPYDYHITALDDSANESADSDTVQETTLDLPSGSQGEIAILPMDEGSGTVVSDASGSSNDGTLVNGPVFDTDTADGSAYSVGFDGIDDYVDLGTLDVSGTGLTLAAWFNADSFPGGANDARLISKANGTAGNSHVFMLSTVLSSSVTRLRARVRIGGVTTTFVAPAGDLSTGQWHHAAATYDGAVLRIYLDGTEVGSTLLSGTVDVDPALSVAVGAQPAGAGGRYFDGLIDDVRILERALSPAEITALGAP